MSGNVGMLALIIALVAFLTVAVLAVVLMRKPATGPQEGEIKTATTMKKVVWVCLGNGFAWVWSSYILAYLERDEIAESLSKVAVTEIIGVVLVYALKSLAENLSKNNSWPDKPAGKINKNTQQDCDA